MLQLIQIEAVHKHRLAGFVGFLHLGAELVGNKRRAIEVDVVVALVFTADAVAGDQRHQVSTGVALLYALPMVARADARVMRLAADGGWVEQTLGTAQRRTARTLGEPLTPAEAFGDLGVAGVPRFEPGVAGVEVVLLVV